MNSNFWAKTSKKNNNGQILYHSVIHHLCDTASVAKELLTSYLSPLVLERLKQGLGIEGESLIRFCSFMAGSHDLGKVSPVFQFQVSEVGKMLAGETLYDCWTSLPKERTNKKVSHGTITAVTLPDFLVDIGLERKLARKLSLIVGGHHGVFPSHHEINTIDSLIAGTNEKSIWRQYSKSIFEKLKNFVGLLPEDIPNKCDNAATILLAGLTTISDWLASNCDKATGFPYANDMPIEEYVNDLDKKAKNALVKQGWIKPPDLKPISFVDLFPYIDQPRELQKSIENLSKKLTIPCFTLVEAPMGEGKTEVALYLADLFQQKGAGGFYIGLPTHATSNAMFERVQKFLKHRYQENNVDINLTLSHSSAELKENYVNTICRLDQVYDKETRVVASEWHTAHKRTLLSPYGVGTIDQALMGVIRSRHQFVRLFGLAGRTVILDEIHAYDIYTSTLLERFLEWLALLGCPVIALSATLPKMTRQKLVNAYARGCNAPTYDVGVSLTSYPRVTMFDPSTCLTTTTSFTASDHVHRKLAITWIKDQDWCSPLLEILINGGCVAVVCSTVDRAQAVYQRLQLCPRMWGCSGLFHGRFLFVDREIIENDCLRRFGKEGNERPYRFVLVATQVIEQSIDIDFDLIISDMAPIDLLLQRTGRLHRHTRNDRPLEVVPHVCGGVPDRPLELQSPQLWIIEPSCAHVCGGVPESSYIYDHHVLLRTWLMLRNREYVLLPQEMDDLIDSVYDLEMPIPSTLEPLLKSDWSISLQKYQLEQEANRTKADAIKLPPSTENINPEQFTRQAYEDDEQQIAKLTRLGEPSVTTIFLQQTQLGLVFPCSNDLIDLTQTPNLSTINKLLMYSTKISKRGLVSTLLKQKIPLTWTSALLKYCRYVILDDLGIAKIENWQIQLSQHLGVVITRINKE